MFPPIAFKKLHPDAVLPTYGSEGAIGLDLRSVIANDFMVIPAGAWTVIKTGLAVAIPDGYYGRIAPRSGLAAKYGIDILAGVIDADYRGEIGVVLVNHSDESFRVDHHERIAQLIFECADRMYPEWRTDLPETARDDGGFGSTGNG